MAKVSRNMLKEIVKECLLEILFEGIDSESGFEEREPIREARQPRRTSRPSTRKSAAPKNTKTAHKRPEAVQAAVSELTSDPMMAAIFTDTANTTLVEQKEKRHVPADNAAAVVDNVDDMAQIFEGANNWASIAFGEIDN